MQLTIMMKSVEWIVEGGVTSAVNVDGGGSLVSSVVEYSVGGLFSVCINGSSSVYVLPCQQCNIKVTKWQCWGGVVVR